MVREHYEFRRRATRADEKEGRFQSVTEAAKTFPGLLDRRRGAVVLSCTRWRRRYFIFIQHKANKLESESIKNCEMRVL